MKIVSTHRGLLLICILAVVSPSLPHAQDKFPATSAPVGRISSNEFTTPVNQRLTPAGTQLELPGMRPLALALSPDGRLLVTAGLSHELVVVNPVPGQIEQHVPLPADDDTSNRPGGAVSEVVLDPDLKAQMSFTGLAFSPNGSRIYLANVNGDIKVFGVNPDHAVKGLFSI